MTRGGYRRQRHYTVLSFSCLLMVLTYFHSLDRPEFGLARWGITIISPDSLPGFQEIVLSDKRINEDVHLRELADKIQDAINRNKFMIHFGI